MAAPVPWRITVALDFRNLYGPEVDELCGARQPDVDNWEAGITSPSPCQVTRLSLLTGFPPAWFWKPKPPMPASMIVCKRGRGGSCTLLTWDEDEPAELRLF